MIRQSVRNFQRKIRGAGLFQSRQCFSGKPLQISSIFPPHHVQATRLTLMGKGRFSTSAMKHPDSSSGRKSGDTESDKKRDNSNIFLDNLGTIFLSVIGLIIASLVRNYYGTQNKNKQRDAIEENSALDPLEIDDLRIANSELTLEVFNSLAASMKATSESALTYEDFSRKVRDAMVKLKGEMFTVELGHMIDRVVIAALQRHGKTSDDPMPLTFWFTVLSLALNASVPARIQALYRLLENEKDANVASYSEKKVSVEDVRRMVGYLQDTCQLVPDAQIIPTNAKYPTQQYERGTPDQLVQWSGSARENIELDTFAAILRSKSVCAWGECYHRKKTV